MNDASCKEWSTCNCKEWLPLSGNALTFNTASLALPSMYSYFLQASMASSVLRACKASKEDS